MSGPYSQEEILRLLERQTEPGRVEETTTTSRVSAMALLAAGALRDVAGPLRYVLANLEYPDHQLSSHERDLPHGRTEELRQCLREAMLGAKRVRDIASDVPRASHRPSGGIARRSSPRSPLVRQDRADRDRTSGSRSDGVRYRADDHRQ